MYIKYKENKIKVCDYFKKSRESITVTRKATNLLSAAKETVSE